MKTINNFILERLKLNDESKIKELVFSDEELREDYQTVRYHVVTKKEKEVYAKKYNCNSLKIADIQLVIAEYSRKNRNNKSEFTKEDIWDFFRLNPPDGVYTKFKTYLEQEQDIFLKYMLKYYTDKIVTINKRRRQNGYGYSYSNKREIRIVDYLKKYLKVA
jgi:hypothetical protein